MNSSTYHQYYSDQSHPPLISTQAYDDHHPIKEGKKKSGKRGGGGVKLSTEPQSVAARERRHRISHRLKTLQSLVPGASKMDTVSLLDHAIHYVHFLRSQIRFHQYFLLLSPDSDPIDHLLPPPPPPPRYDPDFEVAVPPRHHNVGGFGEDQSCFCLDGGGGGFQGGGGSTSTATNYF